MKNEELKKLRNHLVDVLDNMQPMKTVNYMGYYSRNQIEDLLDEIDKK